MADRSPIEWTDATWNPIRARNIETGGLGHFCTHVSEGCRNCYAERLQPRFKNPVRYAAQDRAKVNLELPGETLLQPVRWRRPRMIFVCSMSDLFGEFVPDTYIDRVFAVMALCPQHTFQVLTKRPERAAVYLSAARAHPVGLEAMQLTLEAYARSPKSNVGKDVILQGDIAHLKVWPLPNVWLGTSVEDQKTANERIPHLLAAPAARRFLSAEPLLGPLDLRTIISRDGLLGRFVPFNSLLNRRWRSGLPQPSLDWVICGGESGPNARPMHPGWARDLRDQCQAAAGPGAVGLGRSDGQKGVPFLFKQWGEHIDADQWLATIDVGPSRITCRK